MNTIINLRLNDKYFRYFERNLKKNPTFFLILFLFSILRSFAQKNYDSLSHHNNNRRQNENTPISFERYLANNFDIQNISICAWCTSIYNFWNQFINQYTIIVCEHLCSSTYTCVIGKE